MPKKSVFRISRSCAHKLLYVSMVASVFGSVFSLDLLALTMRYCVGYRPYHELLGSSYTVLLPLVLAACSIFCLLVHVTGIFLCWRLTFVNFVWQYSTFKHRCFSIYRISLVYLSVVTSIAVIVNALCISEAVHKFQDGFKQAISNYHNNLEVRKSMNELQYRFKCCGNQNYKDWFYSPWHSTDFPVLKSQKSLLSDAKVLYLQDTPFSCCNPEVLQPCLHTNILKSHFQSGLSYDVNLTIYQEGCLVSFRNRFTKYLKISVVYSLAFLLALCLVLKTLVYIASHAKTYSAVYLEYWTKIIKLDTSAPGTSSKVENVIKQAKQKFQKIKRASKFGSFTRMKSSKGRKPPSHDGDAIYEEIPLITFSNTPESLQNFGFETSASEHSSIDSSVTATDGLSSNSDSKSQMMTVKATTHHPNEKQQEQKRSPKDILTKRNLAAKASSFPSLSGVNGATMKLQSSTQDIVPRRKVVSEGSTALREDKITDKETEQETDGSEITTADDSTNLTFESSSLPSTVQNAKSEQDKSETSSTQRTTDKTPSIPTAPPKPPRRPDLSENAADSTNLTFESSSLPSTVQNAKNKQDKSKTSSTQRTTNKTPSMPTAPPKPPRMLSNAKSEQDKSETSSTQRTTNKTLPMPTAPPKPPRMLSNAKSEQDKSETSSTQRTTNKTPPMPTAPPKPPRRPDLSKNDSRPRSSNNRNNFSFSNLDASKMFTCNSKSTNTNQNTECTSLSYSAKHSNKAEESFNHSSNGKVTVGLSTPSECSTNLTAKNTCHSRNLSNITQSTPPFSICESPEDHFTLGIGSSEFEKFRYSNVAQHNNPQGDCLPLGNNEPYSSFHSRRFPSNHLLSDDTESHCSLFDENILEKCYGFRRLPKPNNRPYFKQIGFDIDE